MSRRINELDVWRLLATVCKLKKTALLNPPQEIRNELKEKRKSRESVCRVGRSGGKVCGLTLISSYDCYHLEVYKPTSIYSRAGGSLEGLTLRQMHDRLQAFCTLHWLKPNKLNWF